MRAHNKTHITAAGLPQALHMLAVTRAGVDDDEAAVGVANHIAVGAGPGHHAGVGRSQALYVCEQSNWFIGLPIQVVHDLPISAS